MNDASRSYRMHLSIFGCDEYTTYYIHLRLASSTVIRWNKNHRRRNVAPANERAYVCCVRVLQVPYSPLPLLSLLVLRLLPRSRPRWRLYIIRIENKQRRRVVSQFGALVKTWTSPLLVRAVVAVIMSDSQYLETVLRISSVGARPPGVYSPSSTSVLQVNYTYKDIYYMYV